MVRSEKNCGLGGVGDTGRDLQKVKVRNPRDRLVLCDVQLVGYRLRRLLDGPTVCVRSCTKAYDSNAERADFYRQVLGEGLNGAECGANCSRAFNVTARRAARQEDDHA